MSDLMNTGISGSYVGAAGGLGNGEDLVGVCMGVCVEEAVVAEGVEGGEVTMAGARSVSCLEGLYVEY